MAPAGKVLFCLAMRVQRQGNLLHVVRAATRPVGRLSHGLNRRQQQADEDADDRDHHQQLDEGETA